VYSIDLKRNAEFRSRFVPRLTQILDRATLVTWQERCALIELAAALVRVHERGLPLTNDERIYALARLAEVRGRLDSLDAPVVISGYALPPTCEWHWNAVFIVKHHLEKLIEPDAPPAAASAIDPREGDGWEAAVQWQGVRYPRGAEYYQSTHWQLVNEAYRQGRCAQCRRQGVRTQLHHREGEGYGNEQPRHLTELCVPCHARQHGAGVWKRAA